MDQALAPKDTPAQIQDRTYDDWLPLAAAVTSLSPEEVKQLKKLKSLGELRCEWLELSRVSEYLPVRHSTVVNRWSYRPPMWLRLNKLGRGAHANVQDLKFYLAMRRQLTKVSMLINPEAPPTISNLERLSTKRVKKRDFVKGVVITIGDIALALKISKNDVSNLSKSILPRPMRLNASAKRRSSFYPPEVLEFAKFSYATAMESPHRRAMCTQAARAMEATYEHIFVDDLIVTRQEQLQKVSIPL